MKPNLRSTLLCHLSFFAALSQETRLSTKLTKQVANMTQKYCALGSSRSCKPDGEDYRRVLKSRHWRAGWHERSGKTAGFGAFAVSKERTKHPGDLGASQTSKPAPAILGTKPKSSSEIAETRMTWRRRSSSSKPTASGQNLSGPHLLRRKRVQAVHASAASFRSQKASEQIAKDRGCLGSDLHRPFSAFGR